MRFAPQPGAQEQFLASRADIAIYGGAAGGGKSFALVLEGLRHVHLAAYRGIYFRRTSPELRAPGGLWDVSRSIYSPMQAHPREALLEWVFPTGARIKMSHLEHETDKFAHQGAQYDFIAFDEVTHFSESSFWYLIGRARSVSGIQPYIRASCNPDPDSWVATFIEWWIDQTTGFPHPDRVGKLRWFARDGELFVWGDSVAQVKEQAPHLFEDEDDSTVCMSATFIPAKLEDNPALILNDPRYRARLKAQSLVDRARLLDGNWLIRERGGNMFRREWFEVVDHAPPNAERIRYWDLAGTNRRRSDFTAGAKVCALDGRYWVEDVRQQRGRPHETEALLRATAGVDGTGVDIWLEQEIGASAALILDHYQRTVLTGFAVHGQVVRGMGTKVERAKPASAAAEAANVLVVRGAWNTNFLDELQAFPDGAHDDMVDAFVGAFSKVQDAGFVWRTV